jgi:hypothetical protein
MADHVGDTPGQEDLPWDTTPINGWGAAVEGWQWHSIGGDAWQKSGDCPRCRHGITLDKGGGVSEVFEAATSVEDLQFRAERGPVMVQTEEREKFFARCGCTEKHPGRPPRISRGCGQWANIDPPPDNG